MLINHVNNAAWFRSTVDWSVELVWDHPVQDLQVYNGNVDSNTGTQFR